MFLTGQLQRKGVSPVTGNGPRKPVKSVSSINMSPAPSVTNVLSAVEDLAVEARLQTFWQVWPPKKGFETQSCFDLKGGVQCSVQYQTSSHQSTSDKEQICQSSREQLPEGGIVFTPQKQAVEKVKIQYSLAFYNRFFIVPKPNPKMATKSGPQC